MPNPEVKILIKATDEAAKNIAEINKGLRQMDTDANKAAAAQKKLDNQLQAVQDTSFKLAMGFGAVAAASGLLLGTSVKLSARYETMGVVTAQLGKNVGMTEEKMRDLEQAVQDQGISMIASREAIALMMQSEIDLSKATDIARLAQDAAVIANVNSSEAFKRVTRVIQTGSVIMARTIGLTVDFQGAYEDLAETYGTTADKLTALQKVEARTIEVLERSTTIAGTYEAAMETAGKKVLSLTRHIEDSKVMLGDAWLPTYAAVVDLATNSLKTWEDLDQKQKDIVSSGLGYVTVIAAVEAGMFLAIGTGIKLYGVYKTLAAGQAAISLASAGMLGAVGLITAGLAALGIAVAQSAKGAKEAEKSVHDLSEEAVLSTETYEEYVVALNDAAEAQNFVIDSQGRLREDTGILDDHLSRIIDSTYLMTTAEYDLARSVAASDRAMIASADVLRTDLSPALDEAGVSLSRWEDGVDRLKAFDRLAEGAASAVTELDKVKISLGEISKAQLATVVIDELNKALAAGQIDSIKYKSIISEIGVSILGLDPAVVIGNIALAELIEGFQETETAIDEVIDTTIELGQAFGILPTDIEIKAEFDIMDALNNIAILRAEMADLRGYGDGGGYTPPPPAPSTDTDTGTETGTGVGWTGVEESYSTTNVLPGATFNIASDMDAEEVAFLIAERLSQ